MGFATVDVEQHELVVLAGAMATIRRCRPAIVTETSVLLYPRSPPEMFGFLTAEGFVGYFGFRGSYLALADHVPEVHANRETYATDFMGENVIFLPVERDGAFPTRG